MTADELLHEAEEQIEAWLCDLDLEVTELVESAERHAARTRAEADDVLTAARVEATQILEAARAQAGKDATRVVAEAEARAQEEYERLRALAAEHAEAVRALADAEDVTVADEHLESLHEAVTRLRAELSRVVDAAFDAIPAVEATAEAIEQARGGRLRRLFRRH
jgi:hypothetical protein